MKWYSQCHISSFFLKVDDMRFSTPHIIFCSLFACTLIGCFGSPSTPTTPPASSTTTPSTPLPIRPTTLFLSNEEIADGWIQLFDGESLFGWHPQNDVNWAASPQSNSITADSGPIGLLLTDVRFQDFELRCDAKVDPAGNSGIFIRCSENPMDPATDCYEINLAANHPQGYTTGSIVEKLASDKSFPLEDWLHFHITAIGPNIKVKVNDQLVIDWTEDSPTPLRNGYIGLQKRVGAVEFKNIALKPISHQSLFDGSSLDKWRLVDDPKGTFDLTTDKTIHAKGGPAFLESQDTFGNFLLQAAAKTNAPDLNSGIFFRAITGTSQAPSNGYELQIHNGITNNDPLTPANAGTGAIFRRTTARRVTSKDGEWTYLTLIADGLHFVAWVNGYPVTDWTDERPLDDNPRQGARLKPGHLSLQGHDPTTDVEFKNITISDYDN